MQKNQEFLTKIECVFAENKLVGNYDFTEDEYSVLLEKVKSISNEFLRSRSGNIGKGDFKLIFVTLVEIAKRWRQEDDDEDEEQSGFWRYIFKTILGVDCFEQKLYNELTHLINELGKQAVLPIVKTGKKFYATLMMHAFSPKKSINAFFDLCYNVYKNDLDFGFTDGDEYICSIAADRIRDVLDHGFSENKSVAIGSNAYSIKIGLRSFSLHEDLVCEFKELIKKTLKFIDKAFRREYIPQDTRFQKQISEWWKIKAETEKVCRDCKRTYVATVSKQNIILKYVRENERVLLCIPPIRLDSINKPIWLSVYVGEDRKLFSSEQIQTKCGELLLTTKQVDLKLNTLLDGQKDIKIIVKIVEDGAIIYDSEKSKMSSLNREFIIFDDTREINSQVNKVTNYFVYSPNIDALIRPAELTTCGVNLYNIYPHAGEKLAGELRQIYFVDDQKESIRNMPLIVGEVTDVEWRFNSINHVIYDSTVKLLIPESMAIKTLELRIDLAKKPLVDFPIEATENGFSLYDITPFIPKIKGVKLSLYTYEREKELINENLVFFPGLTLTFNKNLYYGEMERTLLITCGNHSKKLTWFNNESEVTDPFYEGELIVKIPNFKWRIDGREWHNEPCKKKLWYKDNFDAGSLLQVDTSTVDKVTELCVVGDDGTTFLKVRDDGKFEIGRTVFEREGQKSIILGYLKNGVEMQIAEFAAKEQFVECPIVFECGEVWWRPTTAFIGNTKSEFLIELMIANYKTREIIGLTTNDEKITDVEEDIYHYVVKIKENFLFNQKFKAIYEGEFIAGNPNKFRFKNKKLVIRHVNLLEKGKPVSAWNDLIPYYFVDRLELCDEVKEIYYKGRLCTVDCYGKIIPLNTMPNQKEVYERTNPVRIELRDGKTLWMLAGYQGENNFIGDFFYDKKRQAICNCEVENNRFGEINLFAFEEINDV